MPKDIKKRVKKPAKKRVKKPAKKRVKKNNQTGGTHVEYPAPRFSAYISNTTPDYISQENHRFHVYFKDDKIFVENISPTISFTSVISIDKKVPKSELLSNPGDVHIENIPANAKFIDSYVCSNTYDDDNIFYYAGSIATDAAGTKIIKGFAGFRMS